TWRRVLLCSLLAGAFPDNPTMAEPTPPADRPPALAPELKGRCLDVLRKVLNSQKADEFFPSIHAAEGLTMAGLGEEVRGLFGKPLQVERDDLKRGALARELVRAGDRSKVPIILDLLATPD